MRIYPKCFAHNFGPVGSAIYCNCGNELFRAIAMNEVNTQQVSIVIDQDGKARCFGQSAPQRIEAYSRVDRFRHARPQEEDAVEADYWFVYAIEFFDADGNITRTQFWVGGAANLLLAEYGAYGPVTPVVVPILSDSSSEDGGFASIETGATSTLVSDINIESGGSVQVGAVIGQALVPEIIIGYLGRGDYQIEVSTSASSTQSFSTIGDASADVQFSLYNNKIPFLTYIASATALGGGSFQQSSVLQELSFDELVSFETVIQSRELGLYAQTGGAASGDPSSALLSMNASISANARKAIAPFLQYASKVDEVMYVAIARHPLDTQLNYSYPDDLEIDYFSISNTGQVTFTTLQNNTQISEVTTASNDWRKSLLELDSWNNGDFIEIPPSTGNECIDRFRRNALCNYQDNILKVLKVPGYDITAYEEGDGTDADDIGTALSSLLTSNGTFEIEEYLAISTADVCTLTLEQSSQRTAVQLSSPALRPGEESKSTFFSWVAP